MSSARLQGTCPYTPQNCKRSHKKEDIAFAKARLASSKPRGRGRGQGRGRGTKRRGRAHGAVDAKQDCEAEAEEEAPAEDQDDAALPYIEFTFDEEPAQDGKIEE